MTQILDNIRSEQLSAKVGGENQLLDNLISEAAIPLQTREKICQDAEGLVHEIKSSSKVGLLDSILAQYGLATKGGVAILRLAEALMRVPDRHNMDALIADKLNSVDWSTQRGNSSTWLVNLLTIGLHFASFCVQGTTRQGISGWPRRFLKWKTTPFVRFATRFTVKKMAGRFVLGKTMGEAINRSSVAEKMGYLYSYDMLGEAALTERDAEFFFEAYKESISSLAPNCISPDFRDNHGVSIKLSAIHPRYEWTQRDRVLVELVDKVKTLSLMAKDANMGISIDAEEADRLELSLEVIKKVLSSPELEGWDGFGIVVQAYGKSAPFVLDWLYQLAQELDRKIAIRLVKGAYWDYEIKKAQLDGLEDFPVYTNKAGTDVSYLCCARKLLTMTDRIYPQFAGHNAHTVSSILEFAKEDQPFEFQRLHGMGEALHEIIRSRHNTKCRIYAPVGEHKELLPYLARRMLENGANSSFLNQLADPKLQASEIVSDPFDLLKKARERNLQGVRPSEGLFEPERKNSSGWDIRSPRVLEEIETSRKPYHTHQWNQSATQSADENNSLIQTISNPSNPKDIVGYCKFSSKTDVSNVLENASSWFQSNGRERADVLTKASNLYEDNAPEIFALLCREAGKTINDAVGELREAVDFLRYYAYQATTMEDSCEPAGIISCISPWNFPLAIFTGQIAGALAGGNGVIAKPSEQTPLIAELAVSLLHEAGVPKNVLQLTPGEGSEVGTQVVSDPRVSGVAFTGSTETAQTIQKNMTKHLHPSARFVAETGGLNAMIVDSTALPEQVVKDIIISSFQSAGQRCSALRILYLQKDIEDTFLTMLFGAMDQLRIGDPWNTNMDIGPLIDAASYTKITKYLKDAENNGRILKKCLTPSHGYFVGPTVIRVQGIDDLKEEIFGPVLHVCAFEISNLEKIIKEINSRGFGLTFGLHSRIDRRVKAITDKLKIGNMYVNRNQIGAVVGSQPFGGEGLSGTGPKAGGPGLVKSFTKKDLPLHPSDKTDVTLVDPADAQNLIDRVNRDIPKVKTENFPGPTGETNQMNYFPRGIVLCLGPTSEDCENQAEIASAAGCIAVEICPDTRGKNGISGFLDREHLATLYGFEVVALWGDEEDLRLARAALAERMDKFIPLVATTEMEEFLFHERLVCTDTTAAGGNATLFAMMGNENLVEN